MIRDARAFSVHPAVVVGLPGTESLTCWSTWRIAAEEAESEARERMKKEPSEPYPLEGA